METSAVLRLALQRSNELLEDKLRLMGERDLYKEAFTICRDALALIAYPDHEKHKQILTDNHVDVKRMREQAENDWHFLRQMDYELAEIAFNQAIDVLRRATPTPPTESGVSE